MVREHTKINRRKPLTSRLCSRREKKGGKTTSRMLLGLIKATILHKIGANLLD